MSKRNHHLALSILAIAIGMGCIAYASVPLYRLFCNATGFNGTTKRAEANHSQILTREITVTFNADVDPNLPWKFYPLQKKVTLKIGENKKIAYVAENLSDKPVTGQAVYNVTPEEAAAYFNKIQCFCFENKTLKAHQKIKLPVVFFIDSEIVKNKDLASLKTITLSYTFFKVKK